MSNESREYLFKEMSRDTLLAKLKEHRAAINLLERDRGALLGAMSRIENIASAALSRGNDAMKPIVDLTHSAIASLNDPL